MESASIKALEEWLETLTDKEHAIFDKGFVAALEAVLEDFTEAKTKIFTKVMDLNVSIAEEPSRVNSEHRRQLLAKAAILDLYERHYKKRINIVKPSIY